MAGTYEINIHNMYVIPKIKYFRFLFVSLYKKIIAKYITYTRHLQIAIILDKITLLDTPWLIIIYIGIGKVNKTQNTANTVSIIRKI